MTWKDILKDNNMKRVRDKDRRRNPRQRDEVDIEPKPKKELPPLLKNHLTHLHRMQVKR